MTAYVFSSLVQQRIYAVDFAHNLHRCRQAFVRLLAGLALILPASLAAQPSIEPGAIEPVRPAPTLPAPVGEVIKVPIPAQREQHRDDGPRIAVSEFVLSYEEDDAVAALHRQSAQTVLNEFLVSQNHQLSIGQLDQAADQVTDHLRAAGYLLAKAILPPQ